MVSMARLEVRLRTSRTHGLLRASALTRRVARRRAELDVRAENEGDQPSRRGASSHRNGTRAGRPPATGPRRLPPCGARRAARSPGARSGLPPRLPVRDLRSHCSTSALRPASMLSFGVAPPVDVVGAARDPPRIELVRCATGAWPRVSGLETPRDRPLSPDTNSVGDFFGIDSGSRRTPRVGGVAVELARPSGSAPIRRGDRGPCAGWRWLDPGSARCCGRGWVR